MDFEEKNADRLKRIEKILVVIHEVVTKHSVQLKNLDSILKDDLVTNIKDIQKESIDYFNSTLMQTIKDLRLDNDEDDDDDSDCSSTESQLSSAKTALRVDKDSEDSFIESHSGAVKEEPVPVTSQGSAQDQTIFNENVAVEPSLTSYGDSQSFAQGNIDIDDWREASARIPIRLLKGVSVCELAESGYYSESELCESYPSGVVHAALMRARGDTATDCKHASLSPNDCLAGGFTTEELVAGGYSETLLGLLSTVPGGALAEAVIDSAVRGGGGCGDGASVLASPSVSDSDLRMLITCPRQHGLRTYRAHNDGFTCDGCKKTIPAFAVGKGCRICNVDFCSSCWFGGSAPVQPATIIRLLGDHGSFNGEIETYGKPHGKGAFFGDRGSAYEGDWEDGQPNGEGRMIYRDDGSIEEGQVHVGCFIDGVSHGHGKRIDRNGKVIFDGEWAKGKPQYETNALLHDLGGIRIH